MRQLNHKDITIPIVLHKLLRELQYWPCAKTARFFFVMLFFIKLQLVRDSDSNNVEIFTAFLALNTATKFAIILLKLQEFDNEYFYARYNVKSIKIAISNVHNVKKLRIIY